MHVPGAPEAPVLTLDTRDGVATVELCRPDLQNRFDHTLHDELEDAVAAVAADADARVLLLVGTGKVFSGGGDAARMLAAADQAPHDRMAGVDRGRRLFRLFADFPKPFVVAVHGHVYGVATSIVLTADAIVSTPGVRFVDPHVHMGLVAGDGGVITWPMNMASTLARRHLLWGEPLLAEDAHRIGVVTDLVASPDEVRPRAEALAAKVAALPPVAVQLTKRTLNKVLQSRIDEAFDLGFYLEAISVGTEDMREAVNAFLEKRKATWKGR